MFNSLSPLTKLTIDCPHTGKHYARAIELEDFLHNRALALIADCAPMVAKLINDNEIEVEYLPEDERIFAISEDSLIEGRLMAETFWDFLDHEFEDLREGPLY